MGAPTSPPKTWLSPRGKRRSGKRQAGSTHSAPEHSPEMKQQRLLQAQQGCAHREEEDGGAEEDVLRAVATAQREGRSGEQEEAEAHQPLQGEEAAELGAAPAPPKAGVLAAPFLLRVLTRVLGEAPALWGQCICAWTATRASLPKRTC